jgi:integrase
VPEDLRPRVGKREEKRSLGTRDPIEAKRLHAQALAEIEARWANLRAGPRTLTEREAHEMATVMHDRWLEMHRDNPSEQRFWRVDLFEKLWYEPPLLDPDPLRILRDKDSYKIFELEGWCEQRADEGLVYYGLVVDEAGRRKFAKAISAAVQRASVTLARWARGEAVRDVGPTARSSIQPSQGSDAQPVRFEELVKGWASERRPTEKILYEWRRVFGHLAAFLGHDDARRVTAEQLIAWKQALIEAGQRPKTIRDAKITPVRAVLQWAVDNRHLPDNPAARIAIDVKQKPGEGKRSFTDEEARIVLRAALEEKDPVKRWVPWLCAYSGARLSEVCQLRREDVVQVDGIWCLKLDPEAGSLKTHSSERVIPLHPAVIECGFLEFASGVSSGPLFAGLSPDKFGNRGGNGTKVLGRWVRGLGLTDGRISPNHSWRHRLKTLGRRHGLAPDMVDAITGHRRRTVADSYGEFEMVALHRELAKIPILKL